LPGDARDRLAAGQTVADGRADSATARASPPPTMAPASSIAWLRLFAIGLPAPFLNGLEICSRLVPTIGSRRSVTL